MNRKPAGSKEDRGLWKESYQSLFVRAAYVLIQTTTGILLARWLGPSEFGLYTLIITVSTIVAMVASLGFPAYLVKQLPLYASAKKEEAAAGLITKSKRISLCVVASLCPLQAFLLLAYMQDVSLILVVTACIFAVLLTYLDVQYGIMRGLGIVVRSQLPSLIVKPVLLLVLIALFITLQLNASVSSAVYATTLATAAAVVLSAMQLPRKSYASLHASSATLTRDWLKGSIPFLALAAGYTLNQRIDIIMLAGLSDAAIVGEYRAAVQITDASGVFLLAISAVLGPRLSTFYARGNLESARRVLVASHIAAVVFMALVCFVLFVAGYAIVNLVFGAAYSGSVSSTQILAVGKLASAFACFSGLALSLLGSPGIVLANMSVGMIVNIALNFLLIPAYQADGAAIATSFSMGLSTLATGLMLKWQLRVASAPTRLTSR